LGAQALQDAAAGADRTLLTGERSLWVHPLEQGGGDFVHPLFFEC
jgi:hypothetical protein